MSDDDNDNDAVNPQTYKVGTDTTVTETPEGGVTVEAPGKTVTVDPDTGETKTD